MKPFLREERAQATIEYMLLLAFAVGLCAMFVSHFIRPVMQKLSVAVSKAIQERLFPSGHDAFHHLRIGR